MFEVAFLENDDHENADGDGGICDVENRAEKDEILIAPEGYPVGQVTLKHGEVEHVNHFAVKDGCVAAFGGKYFGNAVYAVGKNEAVEGAVNDVSERAGKDEGDAGDKAARRFFMQKADEIPTDECQRNDAEQAQRDLSVLAAECHSEGHSFIFGEVEAKPITEDKMLLPEVHGGFYPNLEDLVCKQHHYDQECGKGDLFFQKDDFLGSLGIFCFNAKGGVRHGAKAFLRDQLTC